MFVRRRRGQHLSSIHRKTVPDRSARELDGHLRHLAGLHNQIRNLIGLALDIMRHKKAFSRLGYSTMASFAAQELGMQAGQAFETSRIAGELRHRPVTLRRHLNGHLSYGVLRMILPNTPRELEDQTSALFANLTVAEAGQALSRFQALYDEARSRSAKASGDEKRKPEENKQDDETSSTSQRNSVKPSPDGRSAQSSPTAHDFEQRLADLARRAAECALPLGATASLEETTEEDGETIEVTSSPSLSARFLVGVELARQIEGADLPVHACLEMWAAEMMSGVGADALQRLADETDRIGAACAADAEQGASGEPSTSNKGAAGEADAEGGASGEGEAEDEATDNQDLEREPLRVRNLDRAADRAFWKSVENDIHAFNDHWGFLDWQLPQLENLEHLAARDDMTLNDLRHRLCELRNIDLRVDRLLREGLWRFRRARHHRELDFVDIGHYGQERLHMSRSTVKALVTLEQRLRAFPHIRAALDAGTLHENQAALLVTIATQENEIAWLNHAQQTTVRFLRDDIKEAEHMRVFDPERFRQTHGLPTQPMIQARAAAHEAVRAQRRAARSTSKSHTCAAGSDGEGADENKSADALGQTCAAGSNDEGSEGAESSAAQPPPRRRRPMRAPLPLPVFRERLKIVLDDVKGRYDDDPFKGAHVRLRLWIPASMAPFLQAVMRTSRIVLGGYGGFNEALELCLDAFLTQYGDEALRELRQHPILARDGCRCAVPTCGRRGILHVHHIVYRSHGGDNDTTNLVTLCESHHLYGVHQGRIAVSGHAPDALHWRLGVQPDGTSVMTVEGRTIVAQPETVTAAA